MLNDKFGKEFVLREEKSIIFICWFTILYIWCELGRILEKHCYNGIYLFCQITIGVCKDWYNTFARIPTIEADGRATSENAGEIAGKTIDKTTTEAASEAVDGAADRADGATTGRAASRGTGGAAGGGTGGAIGKTTSRAAGRATSGVTVGVADEADGKVGIIEV